MIDDVAISRTRTKPDRLDCGDRVVLDRRISALSLRVWAVLVVAAAALALAVLR